MNCLLKHFKGIAYFLSLLILFQSCVAYRNTPSTIEEATSKKNNPVKITTKNGLEYEFKWIDELNGNIFSIKNAKRINLEKSNIVQIVLLEPEPRVVPIDQAINHRGTIQFLTKDKRGRSHNYQFIRISERNDMITGYKMTGKDTMTVVIPIDQIAFIELKDKGMSTGQTVCLVIGGILGAALLVYIAAFIKVFIIDDPVY